MGRPVEELNIGFDLVVLVTAVAGGMLARWLRLPIILGYLVGGIAIGPFGLGLVHETETIDSLANIGVVLLMFAIGLEFSLKEIMRKFHDSWSRVDRPPPPAQPGSDPGTGFSSWF